MGNEGMRASSYKEVYGVISGIPGSVANFSIHFSVFCFVFLIPAIGESKLPKMTTSFLKPNMSSI